MEMHLLLEGERIGPLSEAQVRQYLNEGFVSPSDLAMYDGMEDWLPVELVLAHLPPFSPTSETSPEQATAGQAEAEPEIGSFIIRNDTFESFEPAAELPTVQSELPLTSSQKTKRKVGKIVIQPILPLETTEPLKKKSRTGKTTVTLEPLRPTSALPPVTEYPRERKRSRPVIRTGTVSLKGLAEKPVSLPVEIPAPAVVAEPAPADPPAVLPLAVPVPTAEEVVVVPPLPPPVIEFQTLPSSRPKSPPIFTRPSQRPSVVRLPRLAWREIPPAVLYAGIAVAVLMVCVVIGCIYVWIAHGRTTAVANPIDVSENSPIQSSIPSPPVEPTSAADFSDRGMKRQAGGDLDGAIEDYNQAVSLDPNAVEVYYQRGLARQAKRDLAGAITDFTQVIALNPKRANAFSSRGFIKQAQGDRDGALADYAQAIAINPEIPVAYYNVGLIKVQKGDLDGAIAAYNQAINFDPGMAVAYYNRGVAKNTEGNVDGAIADFTQAVTLNPKIALAYSDRGFARQAKGDADGALADYTQALALNPTLANAFYNRGLIKAQKGDLDGAIDDNTQTITLNAKYAQAYNKRGLALLGKGRLNEAQADLRKFCELMPRDSGTDATRLHLWVIASLQNAKSDADAALSTALLNDWNSPPEELTSKIAAFLLGHSSENDLLANAASPDPTREPAQYCRVWYFAGMKRLIGGDSATAAGYFQKSVATRQKDLCEYTLAQAELQTPTASPEVASKPAP